MHADRTSVHNLLPFLNQACISTHAVLCAAEVADMQFPGGYPGNSSTQLRVRVRKTARGIARRTPEPVQKLVVPVPGQREKSALGRKKLTRRVEENLSKARDW